ncbi:MAG: hypothetical protein COB46_12290 [Rhodospirillaceae bacterium]|nr:MAG: hypothetical protein COB46_12290 [Rhodospirillaceae bacterium]
MKKFHYMVCGVAVAALSGCVHVTSLLPVLTSMPLDLFTKDAPQQPQEISVVQLLAQARGERPTSVQAKQPLSGLAENLIAQGHHEVMIKVNPEDPLSFQIGWAVARTLKKNGIKVHVTTDVNLSPGQIQVHTAPSNA